MNKRGLTILFCFVCLKISTVKNMILCQSKQILQIKFVYNISVKFQNKILQSFQLLVVFSHALGNWGYTAEVVLCLWRWLEGLRISRKCRWELYN